jgi:hypothetical protein
MPTGSAETSAETSAESAPKVTEREARRVAEEAREQDWRKPSFAKELFPLRGSRRLARSAFYAFCAMSRWGRADWRPSRASSAGSWTSARSCSR